MHFIYQLIVFVSGVSLLVSVQGREVIDLSHSLNSRSHRWPTNREFELTVVANGSTENGGWYASNNLAFSEHTSTHLDAPSHFASKPGIYYSSTIPVDRLVGPVSLINLSEKAAQDRDYRVSADDVKEWESQYGMIPKGAIVLFDFSWAQYWDSYEDVFGSSSNDTTTFHFPGVGMSAAEVLADREVYGVGIDTPSLDYGPSLNFEVHNFLLEKNIYFLENVGNMSALPAGGEGVTLVVGAMKIDGGTGGPARLIAMVDPPTPSSGLKLNGSPFLLILLFCSALVALM